MKQQIKKIMIINPQHDISVFKLFIYLIDISSVFIGEGYEFIYLFIYLFIYFFFFAARQSESEMKRTLIFKKNLTGTKTYLYGRDPNPALSSAASDLGLLLLIKSLKMDARRKWVNKSR